MNELENEVYAVNLTPWSVAHPRSDHQLIFPLSEGRLLFVWCEYYIRRPSDVSNHPYSRHRTGDAAPCRISAKVSSDAGRTWSDTLTLQENLGVDNVKHPNLLRLASGRILFSFTQRDIKNADLRVYRKYSDDECESWSRPRQISPDKGVYFTNADHVIQHSSGRIILPCHAGPFYGEGDHWKAFCLYSDD